MNSKISHLLRWKRFFELHGNEAATLRFTSLCQHNTDALCDNPCRREKNCRLDVLVRRFAGPDLMKNEAGLNFPTMCEAAE